jgi:hypothetical protein
VPMPTNKLANQFRRIIKKQTALTGVALLIILFAIGVIITLFSKPERSVANYCKIYKEQDYKLAESTGDSYSVTVFSHSSSKPEDFTSAFTELEKVAPNDIQPDVKTLKQIFQKIDSDPSQAISASLSGLSAEESVTEWTKQHCLD